LILADTSVWVDHFRAGDHELGNQLNAGEIIVHPFVVAELALGILGKRNETLALLDLLPQARVAQMSEVRAMVEARYLFGRGIGLVDAHLLASVFIIPGTLIWTRDKPLRKVSESLGIHVQLT